MRYVSMVFTLGYDASGKIDAWMNQWAEEGFELDVYEPLSNDRVAIVMVKHLDP